MREEIHGVDESSNSTDRLGPRKSIDILQFSATLFVIWRQSMKDPTAWNSGRKYAKSTAGQRRGCNMAPSTHRGSCHSVSGETLHGLRGKPHKQANVTLNRKLNPQRLVPRLKDCSHPHHPQSFWKNARFRCRSSTNFSQRCGLKHSADWSFRFELPSRCRGAVKGSNRVVSTISLDAGRWSHV